MASDGNIFITGETLFTANAAFLVKFAGTGAVIWEREWGLVGKGGFPEDDDTDGNGGCGSAGRRRVCRWARSTGTGVDPNLVAVRFDSAGNFVWQRVGGPGIRRRARRRGRRRTAACTSPAASSLRMGRHQGNAFVWTLSPAGKGSEAALWGGDDPFQSDSGASIAVAPNGAIVVAGVAGQSPYTFGRGSKNAKAARTFINTIAGTITAPAGAVADPVAVVMIPAGSETFAGDTDAFLIRVQ